MVTTPRVLFVTLGLNLTGQSVHIANLGEGLRRRGWRLAIAAGALAAGAPLGLQFFRERGFEVFEIPFAGWNPSLGYVKNQYQSARAFRNLISAYEPDVIHIHSATLAPVVRLAIRSRDDSRGVVTTFNNEQIDPKKQLAGRIASRLMRHAFGDRVIAISDSMGELASKNLRISPDIIRGIDLGVDDRFFRTPSEAERSAARRSLGLSREDFVACCIGRLEQRKNQEVLIRAAALLRDSEVPIRVVLAGPPIGDYPAYLASIAAQLGVSEAIDFPGFVDARTVYWASDVNVLPSLMEGFGLVVVEGMLCGTLAVRSAAAGAREQIEDERTGFLIDPRSPSSVADALLRVRSDPEGVEQVRHEARAIALHRYGIGRMAEQVVGIYREAVLCAGGVMPSQA